MRTRFIALALTTFALCATVILPVAAQQRYRVTDLGTLVGDFYSEATAINNRGQVVGVSTGASFVPFLYDNGVMRALKIPASRGGLHYPHAINSRGWVTGEATSAACGGCGRAFIHDGRTTRFLGHLAGQGINGESSARGINSAGHVTGWTHVSVPGWGVQTHAFIHDGKRMRDLGTLGGYHSVGNAINRWGWVAGTSSIDLYGDIEHAFLYKNGVMHDLSALGGFEFSRASAINDKGWVTGSAYSPLESGAFIYDGKTMRLLGPETQAGYDINSQGWVVGQGSTEQAFLYDGTAVRNLNDLLEGQGPGRGQWRLLSANGINDRGQIVGVGLPNKLNTGIWHAFLLTPVVETE